MTDVPGPLHLSGDLSLQVDGAGGVQVRADGADLHIVADDVAAFLARAREAAAARTGVPPGRRGVIGLAESLAAHGITAHLASPTRRVADIGSGVDSRVGALLLGSRRTQPTAAVVLVLAARTRRLMAAGAALAVLAVVVVRRREPTRTTTATGRSRRAGRRTGAWWSTGRQRAIERSAS